MSPKQIPTIEQTNKLASSRLDQVPKELQSWFRFGLRIEKEGKFTVNIAAQKVKKAVDFIRKHNKVEYTRGTDSYRFSSPAGSLTFTHNIRNYKWKVSYTSQTELVWER